MLGDDDMGETYYRLPMNLFHFEEGAEYFIMPAAGDGMIYAGIHDKDYLVFKKTDSPQVGAIVIAEILRFVFQVCGYLLPVWQAADGLANHYPTLDGIA